MKKLIFSNSMDFRSIFQGYSTYMNLATFQNSYFWNTVFLEHLTYHHNAANLFQDYRGLHMDTVFLCDAELSLKFY